MAKFSFCKFGNIHLQKYFLNSLFGMVPVGGLFREKGGFCLEKRILKNAGTVMYLHHFSELELSVKYLMKEETAFTCSSLKESIDSKTCFLAKDTP